MKFKIGDIVKYHNVIVKIVDIYPYYGDKICVIKSLKGNTFYPHEPNDYIHAFIHSIKKLTDLDKIKCL